MYFSFKAYLTNSIDPPGLSLVWPWVTLISPAPYTFSKWKVEIWFESLLSCMFTTSTLVGLLKVLQFPEYAKVTIIRDNINAKTKKNNTAHILMNIRCIRFDCLKTIC